MCGYRGLAVTRLADLCGVTEVRAAAEGLAPHLLRELGFTAGGDGDAVAAGAPVPDQSAISTDLQAVNSR